MALAEENIYLRKGMGFGISGGHSWVGMHGRWVIEGNFVLAYSFYMEKGGFGGDVVYIDVSGVVNECVKRPSNDWQGVKCYKS